MSTKPCTIKSLLSDPLTSKMLKSIEKVAFMTDKSIIKVNIFLLGSTLTKPKNDFSFICVIFKNDFKWDWRNKYKIDENCIAFCWVWHNNQYLEFKIFVGFSTSVLPSVLLVG